MMKRQYISYSLGAILCLLAGSCSQAEVDPRAEQEKTAQLVYLDIEAEQEAFLVDEAEGDLRSYDYTLEGDYKRPLINFGDEATGKAIPVTAFFRNSQTNKQVHVTLYFDKVKGSKTLYRSFSAVNLNGTYTEESRDHWYVKMFVGVYPEKIGSGSWPAYSSDLLTDPDVNQVRILKDELWDISSSSTTFSVPDNYLSASDKWSGYGPRPLPMQTDWTKTSFTRGEGSTIERNSKYTGTKVTFKPIGSVLRVRFANSSGSAVSYNSFSLTGAQPELSYQNPSPIINHMIYQLNQSLVVDADGKVTNTAMSVQGVSDGKVHYHYANLGSRSISHGDSRVALIWIASNPNASGTQILRPTFYTAASGDASVVNGSSPYYRASDKSAPTYEEGKTYKISFTYSTASLDFGTIEWPEQGSDTVTGTTN